MIAVNLSPKSIVTKLKPLTRDCKSAKWTRNLMLGVFLVLTGLLLSLVIIRLTVCYLGQGSSDSQQSDWSSSSDLIILGEEVDITEKTTEEVKTTPEDILHEIEIDSTSNTPELIRRPIFDYDGYFTVEVTVSGITLPPNRPEHRLLYVALFPPDIRLRDHQLILMDNRTDTEERHHLHVRVYSGAWLRLEVAFHIHPRYASFKLYPESFVIRDSMSVRDITSHLFIVYADHWELSLTIKCIEDCQSESNEYGSDYGHLGSGDDFEHDYK